MNSFKKMSILSLALVLPLVAIFSSRVVSQENLQIAFTGEIKTLCQFNMARQADTLDLTKKLQYSAPISLYCNQPMKLEITSENGGMKHNDAKLLIPYTFKVEIPNANFNSTFSSEDMLHTVEMRSEKAPYDANGFLTLSLQGNAIFAGHYQDKITMNLAPNLVISPE